MYRHLKAVKLNKVFQVWSEMEKKTRSKNEGQAVAYPCDVAGKEMKKNQQKSEEKQPDKQKGNRRQVSWEPREEISGHGTLSTDEEGLALGFDHRLSSMKVSND